MRPALCRLDHEPFLTGREAIKYPLPIENETVETRETWSRTLRCLPKNDVGLGRFQRCLVVGGARKHRAPKKKHYDAIFRVGRHVVPHYLSTERLLSIEWLNVPDKRDAYRHIMVMGSLHSNAELVCKERNRVLTHPKLKNIDHMFTAYSKRRQKSLDLFSRTPIYNPSLGFYAAMIAMQLCDHTALYAYDLHILNANASYRGWSLIKDQQHDFVMERKVLGSVLQTCNASMAALTGLPGMLARSKRSKRSSQRLSGPNHSFQGSLFGTILLCAVAAVAAMVAMAAVAAMAAMAY